MGLLLALLLRVLLGRDAVLLCCLCSVVLWSLLVCVWWCHVGVVVCEYVVVLCDGVLLSGWCFAVICNSGVVVLLVVVLLCCYVGGAMLC